MRGLPPFSGFVGKLMLLQAVTEPGTRVFIWGLVLLSSLLVIIGLSRAGSTLFWRISGSDSDSVKAAPMQIFATLWLLLASPMMVVFAGPLTELSQQAAAQLFDSKAAIQTILGQTEMRVVP